MKKKLFAAITTAALLVTMCTSVMASPADSEIPDGALGGYVDIPVREVDGEIFAVNRNAVVEYVGILPDESDYGPWYHGVEGSVVFSDYVNTKFYHRASAQGVSLTRTPWYAANRHAVARAGAALVNNRAYWDADPDM